MRLLSATDVAIALALKESHLQVSEMEGRWGPFWTISDRHGLIEVALTVQEAESRVDGVRQAAGL